MIRVALEYLMPMALPAAIYLAWLMLRPGGGVLPGREDGPWLWLFLAGVLLALATVAGLAIFEGARPGSIYVPAHAENGRVVPGHWEKP